MAKKKKTKAKGRPRAAAKRKTRATKKKSRAKKTGRQASKARKAQGYGAHSILGYKAHAQAAHTKKVVAALRQGLIDSLVAKGRPPAIAKRIVDRTLRAQKSAGKKQSAYWKKVHGQRAAERAQAHMEQHYAKSYSYV